MSMMDNGIKNVLSHIPPSISTNKPGPDRSVPCIRLLYKYCHSVAPGMVIGFIKDHSKSRPEWYDIYPTGHWMRQSYNYFRLGSARRKEVTRERVRRVLGYKVCR